MTTRSPFMQSDEDLRGPAAARRRRQVQRRRAIALGALGLIVLAVSIAIEAGGSGHGLGRGEPPLPRAAIVEATARLARRREAAEDRAIDRVLAYTPFLTNGSGRKREATLQKAMASTRRQPQRFGRPATKDGRGPGSARLSASLKSGAGARCSGNDPEADRARQGPYSPRIGTSHSWGVQTL